MSIEHKDCMVKAVASVLKDHDLIEVLLPIRQEQIDGANSSLDPQRELNNLSKLFEAADRQVSISLIPVTEIGQLDNLLAEGKTVLVGMPKGQDEPPHIVHVKEKHVQPAEFSGDRVRPAQSGYRSEQEYIELSALTQSLMEQGNLQLFIIE